MSQLVTQSVECWVQEQSLYRSNPRRTVSVYIFVTHTNTKSSRGAKRRIVSQNNDAEQILS